MESEVSTWDMVIRLLAAAGFASVIVLMLGYFENTALGSD
jgi:hypothetical protein